MAMINSKAPVGPLIRMLTVAMVMVLIQSRIQCHVEGVHVSIGSMLESAMSVHCVRGKQDGGVRVVQFEQEFYVDVPVAFHGPYECAFAASGKTTTTLDVVNSRCNCASYNGCAWVVRNDGFYCNHDFMRTWA